MTTATTAGTSLPAGTWSADPAHTSVAFEVKHMGFATVRGRFGGFTGIIDTRGESLRIEGIVDTSTVTTDDAQRDAHLATPDFFDVERHAEARFASTSIERSGERELLVRGVLTLKGTAREIELAGVLTGAGTDPWGNERIGVDLSGVIDRREFGLGWNAPLPGGGLLVAHHVRLLVSISAVREA